jgi:hypothetical protein
VLLLGVGLGVGLAPVPPVLAGSFKAGKRVDVEPPTVVVPPA